MHKTEVYGNKNKNEFNKRFSEVFDKILIDKIANSKIEQWSEAGWRGIMLDNGVLWMANSDGIINSYENRYKGLKTILTGGDLEHLQKSIKNTIFAAPNLVLWGLNKILEING